MKKERVMAIENTDNLCWNCLKENDRSNIHNIRIPSMGYGSSFDNAGTEIHLCEKCYQESNPHIWCREEVHEGYREWYKYEKEMLVYISRLPLQGKQFAENEFSCDGYTMEPQDWIDYELGIISHEKCKEYGMYSHQEIKAYYDRFPTCGNVYKKVYSDGSSACYCHLRASGNEDGTCSSNISSECYMCTSYKLRKEFMEVVNEINEFVENEKERLNEMLEYATRRLELLEKDANEYFEEFAN